MRFPSSLISSQNIGFTLAILSAAGFSMKAIYVKQAYDVAQVDAITLLSLRMLFSFPVFLIFGFASVKHMRGISRKDWLLLGLVGVAGYYGASILDFMGLEYISAGLERIILFSYPVFTILIGILFLNKSFERQLVIPMLLCLAGVLCACVSDIALMPHGDKALLGIALVTGSAIAYAVYQAYSEPLITKLGSKTFSILAMLVSIFAVQLHFFIALPVQALRQPAEIYWICLQMALISTVLPVFLQSGAVKYIGISRLVMISTLGPVLTLFFGWLMLDEAITVLQLTGMSLVLAGIIFLKLQKRRVS